MSQNIKRQISNIIKKDLNSKMVLLSGPRQCGKTTLAEIYTKEFTPATVYNWDRKKDRQAILADQIEDTSKLWIFDEIHKYRQWRNWLKGLYDEHKRDKKILVTGSAKLQVFSHGGDSLQGRYFPHRLHPLTLAETLGISFVANSEHLIQLPHAPSKQAQMHLEDLLKLGGFPEPFVKGSEREANRWRLAYSERLVQEEIRNLQKLNDLDKVELMFDRLPDLVGSPLSIENVRKDLEVSFHTAKRWLTIFEKLYAIFFVAPYGADKLKAAKKEKKMFYWDWAKVTNEGARLENLVACHLLRLAHWCEDVEGIKTELRYFRNFEKKEVDFILLRNKKPWFAVEVKTSDEQLDSNLQYFLERIQVPYAFQVVLNSTRTWVPTTINGCQIKVLPLARFLANLP